MTNNFRTYCWVLVLVLIGLLTTSTAIAVHTVTGVEPLVAPPGHWVQVNINGAFFTDVAQVEVVIFEDDGAGFPIAATVTPLEIDPNRSVSLRVPSGAGALSPGSYRIGVRVDGELNAGVDFPSGPPVEPGFLFTVRQPVDLSFELDINAVPAVVDDDRDGKGDPGWAYKSVELGDVDNDGDLDVLAANSIGEGTTTASWIPSNTDRILRNAGDGTFTAEAFVLDDLPAPGEGNLTTRTYDADLVDLNADGLLDIARSDPNANRVFLNDGDGTFTDMTLEWFPTPSAIESAVGGEVFFDGVASADVDADGDIDLLFGNYAQPDTDGNNLLLLNQLSQTGSVNFAIANVDGDIFDESDDGPPNSAHGIEFGFANTDSRPDLFVTDKTSNSGESDINRLLINTGTTFADQTATLMPEEITNNNGVSTVDLIFRDIDGDGFDDIFFVNDSGGQNRLYWNAGGAGFTNLGPPGGPNSGGIPDQATKGRTYDVGAGDLDFDGDLDIVEIANGSRHRILLNQGGTNEKLLFEDRSTALNEDSIHNMRLTVGVGDVDFDLDLDLVTGGWEGVHLYRNQLFDPQPENLDIVFLLDVTNSMIRVPGDAQCPAAGDPGCHDYLTPAKNVLKTFLGNRRPDDRVGLLTFEYKGTRARAGTIDPSNPSTPRGSDTIANKTSVLLSMGPPPINFEMLVNGIDEGSCSGDCTSIGSAVTKGLEMLTPNDGTARVKALVLLTDGAQNLWQSIADSIVGFPSNVRVYTVALGTGVNAEALDDLASLGSAFFEAPSQNVRELSEIYDNIESQATGKQLIPVTRLAGSGAVFNAIVSPPSRADWAFYVDPSDRQMRASLSWQNPNVPAELVLIDPLGNVHRSTDGAPAFDFKSGSVFQRFEVRGPMPGHWLASAAFQGLPGADGPELAVLATSALRCEAVVPKKRLAVGDPLMVTIRAVDGDRPLENVRIRSAVRTANGPIQVVEQAKVASCCSGQYVMAIPPAVLSAGVTTVDVTCEAPPRSHRPFSRQTTFSRFIAEQLDTTLPDADASRIRVKPLGLQANGVSEAQVMVELRNHDGNAIDPANVSFTSSLGSLVGDVANPENGVFVQTLRAPAKPGTSEIHVIVGQRKMPLSENIEFLPGKVDPKQSTVFLTPRSGKRYADGKTLDDIEVVLRDELGNVIGSGIDVRIEGTDGSPAWATMVRDFGNGAYGRTIRAPNVRSTVRVVAAAQGVVLDQQPEIYYGPPPGSGSELGCNACKPEVGAWSVTGYLGSTFPTDDLGRIADSEVSAAVLVAKKLSPQLSVGGLFTLDSFSGSIDPRFTSVSPQLEWRIRDNACVTPYVAGGFGVYDGRDDTEFGWNIGVGVRRCFNRFWGELRYDYHSLGGSERYGALRLGVGRRF